MLQIPLLMKWTSWEVFVGKCNHSIY